MKKLAALDSPVWLQLSYSPGQSRGPGSGPGLPLHGCHFFSTAGGPEVGWGSSLGTRKSSGLFNQGLFADTNTFPAGTATPNGQESSYMIQALIHNSDLLPQSGHEDWRLGQSREGISKKVPGTRRDRTADCLHTSHSWCESDKPQNKP